MNEAPLSPEDPTLAGAPHVNEAPISPEDPTLAGGPPRPSVASQLGQFVVGVILGLVVPTIAFLVLVAFQPLVGFVAAGCVYLALAAIAFVARRPLLGAGVLCSVVLAPLLVFAACMAVVAISSKPF